MNAHTLQVDEVILRCQILQPFHLVIDFYLSLAGQRQSSVSYRYKLHSQHCPRQPPERSMLRMQLSCFMWAANCICEEYQPHYEPCIRLQLVHSLKPWHFTFPPSIHLYTLPVPKSQECHTGSAGHLCQAGNTGTQTHLWLRTEPDSEPTYHFVFKSSFKLQPSVAGAPVVNDNNNIA